MGEGTWDFVRTVDQIYAFLGGNLENSYNYRLSARPSGIENEITFTPMFGERD